MEKIRRTIRHHMMGPCRTCHGLGFTVDSMSRPTRKIRCGICRGTGETSRGVAALLQGWPS